jgi:hypothetical protein
MISRLKATVRLTIEASRMRSPSSAGRVGMSRLNDIGKKHNTDKASSYVKDGEEQRGHDYLRHYEAALLTMPEAPSLVLDLGVGVSPNEYASARMWAEYLPDARVVAVDNRPLAAACPDGIDFVQGDLGDVRFLYRLLRESEPDLVVEDASHRWHHQLLSLYYLMPAVKPGGVYIWEDLHVSGGTQAERFSAGYTVSSMDFLGMLAREIVVYRTLPGSARGPEGAARGVPEMMATALSLLLDRVTLIPDAAILHRSAEPQD